MRAVSKSDLNMPVLPTAVWRRYRVRSSGWVMEAALAEAGGGRGKGVSELSWAVKEVESMLTKSSERWRGRGGLLVSETLS